MKVCQLPLIFLIVQVAADGYLQLTNPTTAIYLDGTTVEDSGYIKFTGSSSQMNSHFLESDTFSITMWVQEHSMPGGTTTLLHLQRSVIDGSLIPVASGKEGATIPVLQKTSNTLTGWIDTDTTIYGCDSRSITDTTLYSWTHYMISVDNSADTQIICATKWRDRQECNTMVLNGNPITFQRDSYAYFGGSPFGQGIVGRLVDVRFYDATAHDVTAAQFLASNKRCDNSCFNLCFGPDTTSCSGFQFIHPYWSEYFSADTTETQMLGEVQYSGTDIEFKGHALGSTEMSVSSWLFASYDSVGGDELWRFTSDATLDNAVGHRMLAAFQQSSDIKISHGVGTNYNLECTVTGLPSLDNEWIHIGASISDTNKQFICCVTLWGQASICNTVTFTDAVIAFTTADKLIIAGRPDASATFAGRYVDFRFWPDIALSETVIKEIPARTQQSCHPSCNEQCWGPDSYSYPRFSSEYQHNVSETDWYSRTDAFLAKHTIGGQNYSVSFWMYGTQCVNAVNPTCNIIRVKSSDSYSTVWGCARTVGECHPCVYINTNANQICAEVSKSGNTNVTQCVAMTIVNTWQHIVVSVQPATTCITIWYNTWDGSSLDYGTPNWASNSACTNANLIEPYTGAADISIGDDPDTQMEGYAGKLVDVRYYPTTTVDSTTAQAMVTEYSPCDAGNQYVCEGKCPGDGECIGPDHTSILYMILGEKNFEYETIGGTSLGTGLWQIKGDSPQFQKWSGQITTYQAAVWIYGVRRLLNSYSQRVMFSAANANSAKLMHMEYDYAWSPQIYTDTEDTANVEHRNEHAISRGTIQFKKYFYHRIAVHGPGSSSELGSCQYKWGDANADCISVTDGGTWNAEPFTFDANSSMYLGGNAAITLTWPTRYVNLRFYPQSSWNFSDMQGEVEALNNVCDEACNSSCIGPGINSWVYTEPLYLTDSEEPFVGDGNTPGEILTGTDDRFENHVMSTGDFSLCTWFYLSAFENGTSLYLLAMTAAAGNLDETYGMRAPLLTIAGGSLYGQVVTTGGDVYRSVQVINIQLRKWYFTCMTVESAQDNRTHLYLYLRTYDGTQSDSNTQSWWQGRDTSYFTSSGTTYYGGVKVNASGESYLNGYMTDIRYFDTEVLDSTQVDTMLADKQNAASCSKRCNGCHGPTYHFCDDCVQPYLRQGSSCLETCPDGAYQNGTICSYCSLECATCTGGTVNDCTICSIPYYHKDHIECLTSCPDGYYPDTSGSEYWCILCHPECKSCTGTQRSDCTSCMSPYYMQPDGSTCESTCPAGYPKNDAFQRCDTCDVNCLIACTGTDSECICADGYYKIATGACDPCLAGCLTCINNSSCLSCKTNYIKDGSQCFQCSDYEGYGGTTTDPGNLAIDTNCTPVCGDGILLTGEECDDGGTLDNDGCSSTCKVEAGYKCESGTCSDSQAPTVSLEYVQLSGNEYQFILYFDEVVTFEDKLSDNLSLSVNNDIHINSWSVDETTDRQYSAYNLEVDIYQDVEEDSILTVEIETKITDQVGLEIQTYEFKMELEEKVVVPMMRSIITTTQAIAITAGGVGGATAISYRWRMPAESGAAAVAAVYCSRSIMFWFLAEILQIIYFMVYISVVTQDMLMTFFGVLAFVMGDFIPNPFSYFIEDTGVEPPVPFVEEENATNFLLTGGSILAAFCIDALLLIFFFILHKICPKVKYFSENVTDLRYAAPLRIATTGMLELMLAIMLQFRNLNDGSTYNISGIAVAAATILFYFLVIFVFVKQVLLQPTSVLDSEDYFNRYGALYEGYKTTRWYYRCFVSFEKVRKLFYVLFLVVLTNYPSEQIMSIIIMQTVWIIMLVSIRPYDNWKDGAIRLTMEFGLWISFMLLAALNKEDPDDEYIESIVWSIIAILGSLVGSFALYVMITSVFDLVMSILEKIRWVCQKIQGTGKKNKVQQSPQASSIDELFADDRSDVSPVKNSIDLNLTSKSITTRLSGRKIEKEETYDFEHGPNFVVPKKSLY